MATILALQPRLEKFETKLRVRPNLGLARVIIFPGVRYERIPEASNVSGKTTRKTRKTA